MGQGNYEDSPPSKHPTEILSPPDVVVNSKKEEGVIVHSLPTKQNIIPQDDSTSESEESNLDTGEEVESTSESTASVLDEEGISILKEEPSSNTNGVNSKIPTESIPMEEEVSTKEESSSEKDEHSSELPTASVPMEEDVSTSKEELCSDTDELTSKPDDKTLQIETPEENATPLEVEKESKADNTTTHKSPVIENKDGTINESYSEGIPMKDLEAKIDNDSSITQNNSITDQPNTDSPPPPGPPPGPPNDSQDELSTTCSQITKFEINTLLPTLGEFGTFQKLLNAILFIVCLPSVYQVLIMYFSTLTPQWRCAENSTVCTSNKTHHPDDHARCTMNRTEWYYTKPKSYSLVTQFDLHCDEEWKLNLASSIIFLGWGFGSIMCGWLGDRYGRKSVFLPSVGVVLTCGFLTTFCTDIYQISACQFVIGFFIPGVQLQAFILISEFVGDKQRALAGILIILTDPVSWCILAVKAYFIQNWKTLSMVATLPYLFVFLFYKFIPESITWLHFNGKTDRVRETARQVAKWNKKDLPEHFEVVGTQDGSEKKENGKVKKTSPLDLFRKKRDAMLSLVQGFLWLVTACCYFGLHMAANDLGGDIYRDFIVLNLVEFPAVYAAVTGCNRIGRKFTSLFSLFCGSIACIVLAFLSPVGPTRTARIALGITGEFCLSITFNALYTWSVEIYDLPVRNKGMAWLQIISRIGSAGAPWMVKGLKPVRSWLPFVALGTPALIGSIISMWLPETKTFKKKKKSKGNVDPTTTDDYIVENEHTV